MEMTINRYVYIQQCMCIHICQYILIIMCVQVGRTGYEHIHGKAITGEEWPCDIRPR